MPRALKHMVRPPSCGSVSGPSAAASSRAGSGTLGPACRNSPENRAKLHTPTSGERPKEGTAMTQGTQGGTIPAFLEAQDSLTRNSSSSPALCSQFWGPAPRPGLELVHTHHPEGVEACTPCPALVHHAWHWNALGPHHSASLVIVAKTSAHHAPEGTC